MAFSKIFMSQLMLEHTNLDTEILEILMKSSKPMSCVDILSKSKIASTSRDISLELFRNLRAKNLVEIDCKVRRQGTAADVALWKLTVLGKETISRKARHA